MRHDDLTHLRTCRFTAHDGQRYTLRMHDSGERDDRGQTRIRYELRWHRSASERMTGWAPTVVLFEGNDFAGSPLHADDSDECVAGLMAFLCLQEGDTDREYFANYTCAQLDWSKAHAEALALAVLERFGV